MASKTEIRVECRGKLTSLGLPQAAAAGPAEKPTLRDIPRTASRRNPGRVPSPYEPQRNGRYTAGAGRVADVCREPCGKE